MSKFNSEKLTSDKKVYSDYLKIGFIQTNLDGSAWNALSKKVNMHNVAERVIWEEVKKGFTNINSETEKPQIIILPELTIPLGYINELKRLTCSIRSVAIAGLDFIEKDKDYVENKAIVLVPNNWPSQKIPSSYCATYEFGKIYFSELEKNFFEDRNINKLPYSHPNTYIFGAGEFGKIGVAICSDFFDLERFLIYRGRIQHLIIISYNRDTESYYYIAEAIARLVYCNVIICNTGHYGDSFAFSPYRDHYNRIIYRHKGQNLFSTQVVNLPVKSLVNAQAGTDLDKKFKSRPPGYDDIYEVD